jgi:hypothetical protein
VIRRRQPIGIVVAGVAHRHIPGVVGTAREGHAAVDAAMAQILRLHQFGIVEAFGDGLALIGHAVPIGVAPAHDLVGEGETGIAFMHDDAERVIRSALRLEGRHFFLESVTIAVAEEVKAPVVSTCKKPAIRRVFEVVEGSEFHR